MPTRAGAPIDRPAPIAAYFAADGTDADSVARCFTENAIVIDGFALAGDKIARLEITA
jgi:hypothetical protein